MLLKHTHTGVNLIPLELLIYDIHKLNARWNANSCIPRGLPLIQINIALRRPKTTLLAQNVQLIGTDLHKKIINEVYIYKVIFLIKGGANFG